MSRSRRKTPAHGLTSAESEKADKVASHRKIRRVIRQITLEADTVFPLEKQLSNPWSFVKDGKTRFDSVIYPKLMRK